MNTVLKSAFKAIAWTAIPVIALFCLVMAPKAVMLAAAIGWIGFVLYSLLFAPAANPH